MVGHRNRFHPHVFGQLVILAKIGYGVHRGHVRVQMEFDAFLRQIRVIVAHRQGRQFINEMRANRLLMRIGIDINRPANAKTVADFDSIDFLIGNFGSAKAADGDRVAGVTQRERPHLASFFRDAGVRFKNFAAEIDVA